MSSKSPKPKVTLGKLIKLTPGKRHGLFESNVGVVRKPIKP